jgi:hypothetical protein
LDGWQKGKFRVQFKDGFVSWGVEYNATWEKAVALQRLRRQVGLIFFDFWDGRPIFPGFSRDWPAARRGLRRSGDLLWPSATQTTSCPGHHELDAILILLESYLADGFHQ